MFEKFIPNRSRGLSFHGSGSSTSLLQRLSSWSVQGVVWAVAFYAVLTQLAGLGYRVSSLLEDTSTAELFRGNDINLILRVGSSAVVALVYCTFGIALVRFKSQQRFAALMALTLLTTAITTSNLSPAMTLPWVTYVHPVFSALNTSLLLYVLLLFPSGSFSSRSALMMGHGWLAHCMFSLLFPAWPCNVVYLESWLTTPLLSLLVCFLPFALAFYDFRTRAHSRLDTLRKRQAHWFYIGTLSLFLGMLLNFTLTALYPLEIQGAGNSLFFKVLHPLLHNTVLLILPLCLGIAHHRHRLFGPEVVVEHTLTYLLLAAASVGIYVLLLNLAQALPAGYSSSLVMVLSSATLALLLHPLRGSLQRAIARGLHGSRENPYQVLSQLAHQLEESRTPHDALETISTTLHHRLRACAGGIEVYLSQSIREVHRWGAPGTRFDFPNHLRFLLVSDGESLGMLWVALERDNISDEDNCLMQDVTRHVGRIVQTLRLNLQLQHSREERVQAHQQELKRIRNNLHDGLAPMLVGLTRRLDTALELPAGSEQRRRIEQVQQGLLASVGDLRRVIYGLRPPILDELGLIGAIRQHALSFPLPVMLELPESIALSAAVEVAVYLIVLEALNNVQKHAHARTVHLHLTVSEVLKLVVEDDGQGFSEPMTLGVGLRSMRERAEELGGGLTLLPRSEMPLSSSAMVPAARGLRVSAWIPLRSVTSIEDVGGTL